jgi:hypothetical protein
MGSAEATWLRRDNGDPGHGAPERRYAVDVVGPAAKRAIILGEVCGLGGTSDAARATVVVHSSGRASVTMMMHGTAVAEG